MAATFGAIILINTLLGLIGLALTFRKEAGQLDLIVADKMGLRRYDFAGIKQSQLHWSDVTTFLRIERAFWFKPAQTLSFDYLSTETGTPIHIPGTTVRFKYLQRTIEQYVTPSPERHLYRWFGGAHFLFTILIFASLLALTTAPIPGIPTSVQGWLVSTSVFAFYLYLGVACTHLLQHYIRVDEQVIPTIRYVPTIVVLGTALFALGTYFSDLVHFTAPLCVFCGTYMLFRLGRFFRHRIQRLPTWLIDGLSYLTIIFGFLIAVRMVALIGLNGQALVYSTAVHNDRADCALGDDPRKACFQSMKRTGQWMTMLDPEYYAGYGFIGYTYYYEEEYEQAVQQYGLAIQHNSFSPNAHNVHYEFCQALAHYAYYRQQNHLDQLDKAQALYCRYIESEAAACGTACEFLFLQDSVEFRSALNPGCMAVQPVAEPSR